MWFSGFWFWGLVGLEVWGISEKPQKLVALRALASIPTLEKRHVGDGLGLRVESLRFWGLNKP